MLYITTVLKLHDILKETLRNKISKYINKICDTLGNMNIDDQRIEIERIIFNVSI